MFFMVKNHITIDDLLGLKQALLDDLKEIIAGFRYAPIHCCWAGQNLTAVPVTPPPERKKNKATQTLNEARASGGRGA